MQYPRVGSSSLFKSKSLALVDEVRLLIEVSPNALFISWARRQTQRWRGGRLPLHTQIRQPSDAAGAVGEALAEGNFQGPDGQDIQKE